MQDALLGNIRPGDRVWDVGAYIGYFALLMRLLCGPGNVYALEPDPANRARLEWVLFMNGVADIHVIASAAGSHEGELSLMRHDGHPAASLTQPAGGLSIPVTTLDALAEQIGAPRLVKMDVEGAEADILRAAPRLVGEVRPLWVVELHHESGQEAVGILKAAGYHIECLNKAESLTHQRHILARPDESPRH